MDDNFSNRRQRVSSPIRFDVSNVFLSCPIWNSFPNEAKTQDVFSRHLIQLNFQWIYWRPLNITDSMNFPMTSSKWIHGLKGCGSIGSCLNLDSSIYVQFDAMKSDRWQQQGTKLWIIKCTSKNTPSCSRSTAFQSMSKWHRALASK